MATPEQIRRRGRWSLLAGTIMMSALLLAILGSVAFGSSVASASFTAGGVVVSGTRYAKQGQTVTLAVNTSNDTKCVEITGAHTARQTSNTAQSSWTFNFTAGAGDGLQTVTAAASPNFNASNCTGQSQSPQNASYVLDNTGPTVTATLVPAANGAGWNNSNVTITWSATDAGSGVQTGPTPASDSQTSNTNGVTKTSTATDRLGNSGSGSVTVRLDKQNPSITGSRTPPANSFGWNNTDVTVSFSCDDGALSGIKSCSGPTTLTTSGASQSVTGTAVDNADNQATATVNNINIDKVAPSLSGAPTTAPNGNNGWYTSNVTIHWTCSDALSGLNGTCPADSAISSEGTGLFSTTTISDKAGNSTTANSSPAVKIDKTAPITNANANNNWNNVDQSITLTPNDGLSGVASTFYKVDGGAQQSGTSVSISAEGDHTLEFWSVDSAGNTEQHHTVHVMIDKTPPTIQSALNPLPNANGWNNSNVTVHFTCGDALSGIASCTADQVVTTEGADQQVQGTALDNAGNSVDGYASVSLDKTAPTISASRSPAANAKGWNNGDVTVSFSCDDTLSGIDICPGSQTLGEGANQSASGTAKDNAGNTASDSITAINVDKTAPTLTGTATPAANGSGWRNGDVTVSWSCLDALSGIDGTCPASETLPGEGSNLSASASVSDKAGNTKTTTVSGIKIDRTAPVSLIDLPAPAADDWYAGPVTVTLDPSDGLSGVAATHYSIDGGSTQNYSAPFSFNQNGVHTIHFWSVDNADNTEDVDSPGHEATIRIDTVNPSISGTASPAANGNSWNNTAVTVSFSCSDDDSGIRVSPPGCPDPVTLSSQGAGQSASGTAYDRVGNSASTAVSGINIDLTNPTVTGAATTSPNGNGWYKNDVTIQWTCGDNLSGIDGSCPANSTITGEGSNLGAGPVSASDKAGNIGQGSVSGIKIDRTKPSVDTLSATVSGDMASVTATASDALSGVDSVTINGVAATKNADGSYSRSVGSLACGSNTITAVATDKAGNVSDSKTTTVTRSCLWVGTVLPPVYSSNVGNPLSTSLSAFKIKSTIPVKFQLYTDAAKTQLMTEPPAGSTAKITFSKYDNTTDTTDAVDVLPSGNANTDNIYRWSPAPDYLYIYNLSTTGKTAGTYSVELTLYAADGVSVLAVSAKQYLVLKS